MNAISYAKTLLESEFGLFNACAGGMDDAQYNWKPAGTANSAAKSHVHSLSSVDFFINATARGEQMLWTPLAAKYGLPESPLAVWTFDGTIPFAAMNEYGLAVQKSALDYVSTLKDDDLDREIETNFFGKKPLSFLIQLAGTHCVGHGGDIAAVKGMQGLKGLPF